MDDTAPQSAPPIIIVGIGNLDRGDDAVGPLVARQLKETLPPEIRTIEQNGEPSALLAELAEAGTAFLIDACISGASVGTIQRFDVSLSPLPQEAFNLSTHGLGLAGAIELARALKQLPTCCIVYAIEAGHFGTGEPLSPPMAAAAGKVADRVAAEIRRLTDKAVCYGK